MPTPQETDLLYKQLLARRDGLAKEKTNEVKQIEKDAGELPSLEGEGESGVRYIDTSKGIEWLKKDRELGLSGQAARFGRAADDLVRLLAGPAGNILAGAMSPSSTIQDETLKTEESRARIAEQSPALATGAEITGQVGQALALPGAAFATPMRAVGASAVLGVADTFFNRLEKGLPVNEGAEEYITSGLTSAGTGLVGYHLGKVLGNLTVRFGGGDPSFAKVVEKTVNRNKKISDNATIAMKSLVIRKHGLHRFLRKLEDNLANQNIELSPYVTREAWRAVEVLRRRTNQNTDISLDSFKELRNAVVSHLKTPNGLTKSSVTERDLKAVNTILDEMDKFVYGLPGSFGIVKGRATSKAVSGWKSSRDLDLRLERTEKIGELIVAAEVKTGGGGAAFEQALQEEFQSLFTTKAGREYVGRVFTPQQQRQLRKIADGDVSRQAFERLERWAGETPIVSFLIRSLRQTHGSAFEAEESRELARKVLSTVAEQEISRKIAPRIGTIGAVETEQEIK